MIFDFQILVIDWSPKAIQNLSQLTNYSFCVCVCVFFKSLAGRVLGFFCNHYLVSSRQHLGFKQSSSRNLGDVPRLLEFLPLTFHSRAEDSTKMSDYNPQMKCTGEKCVYFPLEIIREILLRLPVKCLVKCTAVCNSWRSLIRNCHFIHTHSIQSQEGSNSTLFLVQEIKTKKYPREFFSLHLDDPISDEYTALGGSPLSAISKTSSKLSLVVGSCNGLVCLADFFIDQCFFLMLWNPCTRKFLTLPNLTIPKNVTQLRSRVHYGFGFDSQKIDYKVVRIFKFDHPDHFNSKYKVDVYSSNTGLWNTINVSVPQLDCLKTSCGTFVNGFLHWVACHEPNENDKSSEVFILSFDLGSELFKELPVPKVLNSEMEGDLPMGIRDDALLFGGLLALFRHEPDGFRVWTMQEYGVPESWTLLLSIGPILPVGWAGWIPHILSIRMMANMLIVQYNESELLSVDLETKQCYYTFLDDNYRFISPYVETLALFDNISAVSH